MSFKIVRREDQIIVPVHILHNPKLSLESKGAAAVMYSYADLCCTTVELAQLLGVSEEHAKELVYNLQNAGYEDKFKISEHDD